MIPEEKKTWLDQPVLTADGSLTLFHPSFGETFHSSGGALLETEKLYLEASGIKLWSSQAPLHVLDVGLGLGFNACSTLFQWFEKTNAGDLFLLSLEQNADLFSSLRSQRASWQENWRREWRSFTSNFYQVDKCIWETEIQHPSQTSRARWRVVIGDAGLCQWGNHGGAFHFIWQDAFSPRKNPGLWTKEWFSTLREISHPEVKLMTYSSARIVKTALEEAGWRWEKIPATGQKKHWLTARL